MAPVTTETEILLPASPAEVFPLLLDTERYGHWQPLHESWPEGAPELATGGSFVQRTSFGGRRADVRWTVDRLDEPRTVSLVGTGPMGLRLGACYHLQQDGSGTRLTATSAAEGGAVSGPLKRVARKRAQGVAEETLENLRLLVAGSPPPPPAPDLDHPILRFAGWALSPVPRPPVATRLMRRVPGLRRVV